MAKRQTIEDLKKHLAINKYALDEELENQAVIYFEISENCAEALSYRDEAKQAVELVDAEVADAIRKDFARRDEKLTEAKLSQEVLLSAKHVTAYQDYLDTKKNAELWMALKESFSQKGHALREMADLYVAGYFAGSDIRGEGKISKGDVAAERGRAALASGRKTINRE